LYSVYDERSPRHLGGLRRRDGRRGEGKGKKGDGRREGGEDRDGKRRGRIAPMLQGERRP